jgi:hypothetical protein
LLSCGDPFTKFVVKFLALLQHPPGHHHRAAQIDAADDDMVRLDQLAQVNVEADVQLTSLALEVAVGGISGEHRRQLPASCPERRCHRLLPGVLGRVPDRGPEMTRAARNSNARIDLSHPSLADAALPVVDHLTMVEGLAGVSFLALAQRIEQARADRDRRGGR